MKRLRASFLAGLLLLSVLRPTNSYAGPAREILLTSTYGLLAGSLVGLASIAFTGNPGSSLRNVAIGASVGLYIGIALGLYVAYGVSLSEDDPKEGGAEQQGDGLLENEEKNRELPKTNDGLPESPPEDMPNMEGGLDPSQPFEDSLQAMKTVAIHWPTLSVAPTSDSNGQWGWAAHVNLLRVNF